jgi:hypothetical protein
MRSCTTTSEGAINETRSQIESALRLQDHTSEEVRTTPLRAFAVGLSIDADLAKHVSEDYVSLRMLRTDSLPNGAGGTFP